MAQKKNCKWRKSLALMKMLYRGTLEDTVKEPFRGDLGEDFSSADDKVKTGG